MAAPHQDPSASEFKEAVNALWQEDDVAKKYENAEKATRPFGKILVDKSGLAHLNSDAHVFDLATGTGAVVKELYDAVPKEKWGKLKILAADVSPPMLEYVKKWAETEGWTGTETQIVDGNNIDLPANTYTHIFVSFAIFVMPDALPKLYELLKPGGFIGVTTLACLPWHSLLARSIARMADAPYSPSSSDLEEKLFSGRPWGDHKYVVSQLREVGLHNVDAVREKKSAQVGTPKLFMESMSFVLQMVGAYWEEGKREEWLKELNGIMLEESAKDAGGEEEQVTLEFDGIAGWGWKSG
ncbi:S-adenosyl-L-methionine-dependent methyltransferase [Cucurbitaria berberidis CBS 394.84]|uniref:S-adenosyl-L-methionine-dependent methyltransferase n=1 Tax=Cucurbitaria berberidis CBS 394.84 TaxID=1168544 RepID=A0A9P4L8H1_9PLEO|nr:S-adenosyl-L-methionine-dependent methyltransferase [Cucurbitaria berberidis CBS 394.84]KAF1846081.1 S-adenosyl-L-methionine-dependent methyltransferase [Cucurbitaria berberidis CBS 394.84]